MDENEQTEPAVNVDVSEEIIAARGEPRTAGEAAFLNTVHQRKVIKEFAANMKDAVYRPGDNGHTDPFKLSNICRAAGQECREVMRETGQQQRQNPQEDKTGTEDFAGQEPVKTENGITIVWKLL
jgi:hypothetical protein